MRRSFTTELNSKDLENIQKDFENWAKKLEKANKEIVNDLAEYGSKKMKQIYDESGVEDSTPMLFIITNKSDLEKEVEMRGQQALYDEFGTGTEGEKHQHPIKDSFGLDAYNSHKVPNGTIRHATEKDVKNATQQGKELKVGDLFWTYRDSKGQKHYTQGVAAQKEGYDSLKATIKKAPSIIKKRMGETLE